MSVLKEDAFRFGGFDECPSYRGYLCGPYDLGWRLCNAGIPEIWHDLSTVLWHFAHPDPVGVNGCIPSLSRLLESRYPHVDLHALTAVEHFSTGRILPNRENPEIHTQRMARRRIGTEFESKYANLTGPRGFCRWHVGLLRLMFLIDLGWTPVHHATGQLGRSFKKSLIRSLKQLVGDSTYARMRRWYAFWLKREPTGPVSR